MDDLPLRGIRVVEIGQNISGPFGAEILAMLGADVIKIERPEGGDDGRYFGNSAGASPTFHTFNRNKKSVTVDLKDATQLNWLRVYLRSADVLLQNLRPGTLDELGLGAESLIEVNPRLIYCSIRAYGSNGPLRLEPGYELMVQAFAGIFSVNGGEGDPPTRANLQILDMGTAMWTAIGCLAALFRRTTTGRGGVVDTSLFETALSWLTNHIASYSANEKLPERHRSGSARLVVYQSFTASDGDIVIGAGNDRLFRKLAVAIGRPEWIQDERYATNAKRLSHRSEIAHQVAVIVATRPVGYWLEMFRTVGIPCSPIQDLRQVLSHPQTRATGIIQNPPGVKYQTVALPIQFDGVRPPIISGAPDLGADNAILGGQIS